MNKIFAEILRKRGILESELTPKYEDLLDPFLLPDMMKCVERIEQAIDRGEKILIYGDYDVDGVTASACLVETLRMAGMKDVEVMLPDRFEDGYGMSKKVVQRAVEKGVNLVITVDCGSSNEDIIGMLAEHKIYTIVTDHHELIQGVPKSALAVVNPKRTDVVVAKELTGLCGVGVVFEIARALVARGKIKAGQEKWLMDLVVLGMVADSMRMTGENWRICYFGMLVLQRTRRVGLVSLMRLVKVDKIDTGVIGFRLAPRLNAAGRMESADLALKLLLTKDRLEAENLAGRLMDLNDERKKQQDAAIAEVIVGDEPVIVAKGKYHEGIIGIVAGRILEENKRPVFIFTEVGERQLKCSGRSFGEFDLSKALQAAEDLLIKGGGHAAACGATIDAKDFVEFGRRVNEYYRSLKLMGQERFLAVQPEVEVIGIEDLTVDLVENLAKLEPFGEGNEEPILLLRGVRLDEVRKMGKEQNHLSLWVERFKMVAFFAPDEWLSLEKGELVDILIKLRMNEWNGVRSAEGEVVEVKRCFN